jgi:hypothetical protein
VTSSSSTLTFEKKKRNSGEKKIKEKQKTKRLWYNSPLSFPGADTTHGAGPTNDTSRLPFPSPPTRPSSDIQRQAIEDPRAGVKSKCKACRAVPCRARRYSAAQQAIQTTTMNEVWRAQKKYKVKRATRWGVRVVSECECDPSSKCEVQRRVEKE